MIDKSTALSIATDYVSKIRGFQKGDLLVVDAMTIETSFGWIFPYDHRRGIEQKDRDFRLAGNRPLVVHRDDGAVRELAGFGSLPNRIAEHERKFPSKPKA